MIMITTNFSRMYYRLIVPYIALDLPVDVILTYNRIEENDPLVAVLRYSLLILRNINTSSKSYRV